MTELTPEGIREHYAALHKPIEVVYRLASFLTRQGSTGTLLEAEFKKVSDFAPPQLRTDSAQLAANKPKNRFQVGPSLLLAPSIFHFGSKY